MMFWYYQLRARLLWHGNWIRSLRTADQKRAPILVKAIRAKLGEVAMKTMKTKYILVPVLALIVLATCISGCVSTTPSGGQGNRY